VGTRDAEAAVEDILVDLVVQWPGYKDPVVATGLVEVDVVDLEVFPCSASSAPAAWLLEPISGIE